VSDGPGGSDGDRVSAGGTQVAWDGRVGVAEMVGVAELAAMAEVVAVAGGCRGKGQTVGVAKAAGRRGVGVAKAAAGGGDSGLAQKVPRPRTEQFGVTTVADGGAMAGWRR
jgi:hypothetical protein